MGDFNVNLLKEHDDNLVRNFYNSFKEHSFFPVIDKPTRVQKFSATLLDQIFVNFHDVDVYRSNIYSLASLITFPSCIITLVLNALMATKK